MVKLTVNGLTLLPLLLLLNVRMVKGVPFCHVDEGGRLMRGNCYCNRATDNRAEYR